MASHSADDDDDAELPSSVHSSSQADLPSSIHSDRSGDGTEGVLPPDSDVDLPCDDDVSLPSCCPSESETDSVVELPCDQGVFYRVLH